MIRKKILRTIHLRSVSVVVIILAYVAVICLKFYVIKILLAN